MKNYKLSTNSEYTNPMIKFVYLEMSLFLMSFMCFCLVIILNSQFPNAHILKANL